MVLSWNLQVIILGFQNNQGFDLVFLSKFWGPFGYSNHPKFCSCDFGSLKNGLLSIFFLHYHGHEACRTMGNYGLASVQDINVDFIWLSCFYSWAPCLVKYFQNSCLVTLEAWKKTKFSFHFSIVISLILVRLQQILVLKVCKISKLTSFGFHFLTLKALDDVQLWQILVLQLYKFEKWTS
jgi:hypothetical protein